ncbi:MAG TPA: TonB-dependent receptor [Pyrinomonadaceae bacterium]|nr:TonB-dependent receptor [Pyrinomonadaceae bacterium]
MRKGFLFGALLLLFGLTNLYAQGTTGQISGTVTDQNGAVVSGANVKVTSSDTNFSRTATSNEEGFYSFQLLPVGKYTVEITAQNFQAYKAETVVSVTQTTVVDAQLGVSGDTVTVNVEAPVLQLETSQNGRTVEGETIRQLPLPTRNFQQLLTLQAGAQSSVSNTTELGRGDATISVNGQRTTSNSVRINGVDANSIGTNSTPNIAVPATDSLQEFVVQTSLYDASNGRNAGGNVEAITRSGSNDFRGNVYYFLRDKSLTANEPFIKGRGLERPEFRRQQFGGTLGGRVIRDRVFFFGSYQGTRERNGYSLVNSLTSPNIPLGLTDSNRTAAGLMATFGAATVNPVSLAILNARLPNGQFAIPSSGTTSRPSTCLATLATNLCPVTVPQSGVSRFRENQFNANGDFIITDTHNISAKFFVADNPTFQSNYNFAGLGNGERQLIGFGGDLTIKQKLYSITDNYIFSPNIVNQARFGFNRLRVTSVPEEPFSAASLGITNPLGSLFPGAPTIQLAGLDSQFFFGSAPLADQSSRINGYNFSDVLSVTKGNHRLRFGGEYRFSQVKFYFNAFSRGQIIFSSFNSFLSGVGTSLLGSGVFDRYYKVKDTNFFAQDDWKVNNRLTINIGLRYDLYGLPVENKGRLVNLLFDQIRIGTTAAPASAPNGFVQADGGGLANVPTVEKTLVPVDKNNFAPRFGFAYVLDEKLNMVLRGGYGIYYDRISTRYANTQLFNYPYFALGVGLPGSTLPGITQTFANPFIPLPAPSQFPIVPNLPSPLSPLSPFVGVPVAGVYVDPNLRTPYIQQFNFGLQWGFWKNFVWDIGYVGNKGTNLLQVISPNQPIYNSSTNSFATPFAGTVISALKNATGGVQQIQTTSLSTYHSLQTSLTKRFSDGLQFQAAYTFGKSIDYYSGAAVNEVTNVFGDQRNWRTNRGRSDFNREHRFVISGVYSLPKYKFESGFAKAVLNGWQVAGIAVFQSGLPFSIVDNPGNAVIQRANYNRNFTGDIYTSGGVSQRLNGFFNTAAFVRSCPIGTLVSGVLVACANSGTGAVNNPLFDPANPFGNTTRNGFTGPGQKNVDISLIKFIPFTERIRGEFRIEAFNVFNWVNYALPNNNVSGANFGRIERAATGPRVLQLGMKLNF